MEAGFVATLLGAPLAVVTGGVGSLLAALLAAIKGKSLVKYEKENSEA